MMKAFRRFRSKGAATGLAIALSLSFPLPVLAQTPDDPYRISTGDVLSIVVYGDEELSGEFRVSPDGSIAYPVVGNVSVDGLTPTEVADRLDKALAQYIPGLTVSATIAQYSPVFVVGDVENPGQYEYRPGMIALELVALGGGKRREAWALDSSQMQLIAARQEYSDLTLQIFGQEARRARLQAELEGKDFSYSLPEEANSPAREAQRRMVAGERMLFSIRQAALNSEDQALAAQEQSYADEIKQLEASIDLYGEELELLRQDVASNRDLAERGLTARSNLREVERRLSAARRDELELRSYLARAQQNRIGIQQRRKALVETRRSEAAEAIRDIDLDLARMRAQQRALLDTMAEVVMDPGDRKERQGRPLELTIMRSVDGEYQELAIGERNRIRPGDILRATLPLLPGQKRDDSLPAIPYDDDASDALSSIARQER